MGKTKVSGTVAALVDAGLAVDVYDPVTPAREARVECGVELIAKPENGVYDLVALAVPHGEFAAMGADAVRALLKPGGVPFNLKWMLPKGTADLRL